MIVLFTDFGTDGPYVGQMKARLHAHAPGLPVVDLMHDVPPFDAEGAAYLLAAYADAFQEGSVFVGVVDPGVGSERRALAVLADGRWYVGPDNGLFEIAMRRSEERGAETGIFEILWRPQALSASFHGRDLFAPVAAGIATGEMDPKGDGGAFAPLAAGVGRQTAWADDLARVLYIDRYGNAVTGLRAAGLDKGVGLDVGGWGLARARTFADVPPGTGFWYENANGLVEVAVNQGAAASVLGLAAGSQVRVTKL